MPNNVQGMKVLVTGTAGFIGYHLIFQLLQDGFEVIGLDNINDYYDVNLKYSRLKESGISHEKIQYNQLFKSELLPDYSFIKLNLEDKGNLHNLFKTCRFDYVVHLAAQAGVRYSLTHPDAYVNSNIIGFLNILEACRNHPVNHLVYASSSSVYGLNRQMPFSVHDNVDHPVSLYAASKKSNELMAHTYSHLYNIPTTGLRLFTVYGPWGRPDMALFIFTRSLLEGKPIDVYNRGNMVRDFTYIDDIVKGILHILKTPPKGNDEWNGYHPDPSGSPAPYRLYNIGNNKPVQLLDFIKAIEKATGKTAALNLCRIQPGDVEKTWADVSDLVSDFNYAPDTDIRAGIKQFVEWYRAYYKI